jgi:hypothetical protein
MCPRLFHTERVWFVPRHSTHSLRKIGERMCWYNQGFFFFFFLERTWSLL